ncbi:MAG TPA: hypothetical protein VFU22_04300 [Roseiflexaceae bacterium]|nr:hypothetical protein [Roseiflexaceae bacterium]
MLLTETTRLHVRFNGRSEDLALDTLGLGCDAGDNELRAALARRYDCPADALDGYVIVRGPQAIIVRPVAIYG